MISGRIVDNLELRRVSMALPQKSGRYTWTNVSTTCGSGWVDDEHGIFQSILNSMVDPPATAGGTDSGPSSILTFEAKQCLTAGELGNLGQIGPMIFS